MDLQAILDRFEFRPEPEATLIESVADLRAAIPAIISGIEDNGGDGIEMEAALRTARDRIQTCYGIIEAHGFEKPIVEGSIRLGEGDLDWSDVDAVVGTGDGDVGTALEAAYESLDLEPNTVADRIGADRLDLLGVIPDRLPEPAEVDSLEPSALKETLLLIAAVAYGLSGFGTHPGDIEPAANRVYRGYWLLAAVLSRDNR
jgi:hypothetical protein